MVSIPVLNKPSETVGEQPHEDEAKEVLGGDQRTAGILVIPYRTGVNYEKRSRSRWVSGFQISGRLAPPPADGSLRHLLYGHARMFSKRVVCLNSSAFPVSTAQWSAVRASW